ncbi:hypothetical protein EV421DRAFT_515186 [Armillaria borealis]|uniref:Ribonuclease H1 N-terminal domain-containing protein n=1 Tax=Armillaria borealis TaxID=47425 RepID=A0AA39JJM4_9AGAR|nr:hypothetical protein EV421DRAFT_515186 [Armillaria borealis]
MAQQSLNLAPEALAALLEALNALTVRDAAPPSTPATSAPGEPGSDATAASTAATDGPEVPVALSEGEVGPSPTVASGTSSEAPVVARALFTCAAFPATFPARIPAPPVASSSRVPPTQQPPAQVHSGFHCSNCGAFNPTVGQLSEAWYVVTARREVGIFSNWEVVQPLVSGVAHVCHKKYKTRAEAEEAFQAALAQGKVRVL